MDRQNGLEIASRMGFMKWEPTASWIERILLAGASAALAHFSNFVDHRFVPPSLSSSLIQQPDWFGPAGGRRRPDIVMGWTLELERCKNMLHINNDIFLHTRRTPKSYFQTLSVDIFLLSKGIRTTLLLSAVLCSQFSPSLLEADSGVFLRETVNTSKGEGGR